MKFPLLIIGSALLSAGAFASASPEAPSDLPMLDAPQSEAANIPEPNSLIAVGIGSLAILLFAVRRK